MSWERVESKIDVMNDRINVIEKHLAVYNAELTRHIEGVEQNRSKIDDLDSDVEEITKHVHEVKGSMKFAKGLSIFLATSATLLGILKTLGVF